MLVDVDNLVVPIQAAPLHVPAHIDELLHVRSQLGPVRILECRHPSQLSDRLIQRVARAVEPEVKWRRDSSLRNGRMSNANLGIELRGVEFEDLSAGVSA